MTEKRYNVWDIDGTIFLEDHKEGSYHIGQVGNVDINCLNDIANRLNDLTDENEQLKQSVSNLKDTIIKITIAYQRKYDRTIVDLVDEVHDEDITDLIKELQE